MKKTGTWILILALLMSLTAIVSAEESAYPIDTFIVGTSTPIETGNRAEYNFDILTASLSQLAPVALDGEGNYVPSLCDFSTEDAKTWTLRVREGMKWHDGEAVTAEDIAFTMSYLDEQAEAGYASAYEDIRVIDERTLELELATPNPRQMSALTAMRILPKHIYDGVEDYTTVENDLANIGCGPYRFVRFDPDAAVIEFAAFADYPQGAPNVKTILVKLYDSDDTLYMALKSGEVDMFWRYSSGVGASVLEDLAAAGGLTLEPIANTANSAVLIFNNAAAPWDNVDVRMAVAEAIDYEQFRAIFGSAYAVASRAGFIPEGNTGYVETDVLTMNLDSARARLEQAGLRDDDGDGFVEYNGGKLTLSIMLRADKPVHSRYAELVKNCLAEIGIDVELDVREVADFRDLTENQRAQDAVITGLTAYGMNMKEGMSSLYLWHENSMSYGQVADADYKALLDRADAATTMDAYKLVAADMQAYYAQTMPAIALFWDKHVQVYNSRFSGFVVDGTFGLLNVNSWYSVEEAAA